MLADDMEKKATDPMQVDLTDIFEAWPYDAEDDGNNVRCIRAQDGRQKILVRVRSGVFQWEFEDRPDGLRPHGYRSLLDYYEHRINELLQEEGSSEALRLGDEEVAEIGQELLAYYQRRVLFFRLGEFERARADALHNLRLMDILRDHANDPEEALQYEQYRPFVTMDRARAEALAGCEDGDYLGAIRTLDRGMDEIASFFHEHQRDDLIDESQEIGVLQDLKYQLREAYGIPLTSEEMLDALREEQEQAIEDEDFERAARLRDEIARIEERPKLF